MNLKILHNPWLELVLRWILGVTFVYSSLHKIAAPAQFAKVVFGYSLFAPATINLIAITVPFVELFAGAALLLGVWPRSATLVVETLLGVFAAVLTINLVRGVEFDCGCFSFQEAGAASPVGEVLARDALYLLAGLQVLLFRGRRKGCLIPDPGPGPPSTASG